jgi:hypothetical protein
MIAPSTRMSIRQSLSRINLSVKPNYCHSKAKKLSFIFRLRHSPREARGRIAGNGGRMRGIEAAVGNASRSGADVPRILKDERSSRMTYPFALRIF